MNNMTAARGGGRVRAIASAAIGLAVGSIASFAIFISVAHAASISGSNGSNFNIANSPRETLSRINISRAPAGAVLESINVSWSVDHDFVSDVFVRFASASWSSPWLRLSNTGDDFNVFPSFKETSASSKTYRPTGQAVNQKWWMVAQDRSPDGDNGRIDSWSITVNYTTPPTKPDLVVTVVDAPASAFPGEAIPVRFTVKNQGGSPSVIMTNTLYLSTNPSITTTDTDLGK